MSMFVCYNEENEKVEYILSNNIEKVNNYLESNEFIVTEMPSYLTLTVKSYITL